MNVHELKEIYNLGTVANHPNKDTAYFNYFDGVQYLHILNETLKHQELLLLKSMMSDNTLQSDWHDFLVRGIVPTSDIEDSAQFIHFNVKKLNENQEQWLNSFQSYFDKVHDTFFLNDDYGLVILESYEKDISELQGFISMLDDDFSTVTSVFIGLEGNRNILRDIFKEEQNLFRRNIKNGQVINFVDAYIPYYIAPQLNESFIGQEIRKTLESDNELVALVQSLWLHQGNLSAAAEDLYIHRNTINYRMDKLYNEHNLNLRDMQQLLLCYLLTL